MIASVRGTVRALGPDRVVVEVGGVGLALSCSPAVLARLRVGEPAELATSLVVRETELTLYGFADDDARTVFEVLQSASGVGPRLALAVLSVHEPDAVRRAVAAEDLAALTLVPGIGRKGAQRMVLELRDRLGAPTVLASASGPGPSEPIAPAGVASQLQAALLGLGYSTREADEGVTAVGAAAGGAFDADAPADGAALASLLRQALAVLRRG